MIFMDIDCLDFVGTNNDDLRGVVTKVKAEQKKSTGGTHTNYEMPAKLGNKLL